MDKKKLNAKDFINIGIFTVIYFVMFFITGMMGYIPIFAVIIPLVLEFKDVAFQYEQGSSKGKIENINLTIHDGEVVLICG